MKPVQNPAQASPPVDGTGSLQNLPELILKPIPDKPGKSKMTIETSKFYLYDGLDKALEELLLDKNYKYNKDKLEQKELEYRNAMFSGNSNETQEYCDNYIQTSDKVFQEQMRIGSEQPGGAPFQNPAIDDAMASRHSDDLTPDQVGPGTSVYLNYLLTQKLGQGGFGAVFRGDLLQFNDEIPPSISNTKPQNNQYYVYGNMSLNDRNFLLTPTNSVAEKQDKVQSLIQAKMLKEHFIGNYEKRLTTGQQTIVDLKKIEMMIKKVKQKIIGNPKIAIKFYMLPKDEHPPPITSKRSIEAIQYNCQMIATAQYELRAIVAAKGRSKDDTALIGHDNLIQYYWLYPEAPHLYAKQYCVGMELAEKGTLHELMEARYMSRGRLNHYFDHNDTTYPLNDSWAKHWFLQLLAALQFLHKRNIAHHDLKEPNLLLSQHYDLKVTDLGMASMYSDVKEVVDETILNCTVGYFQPEQPETQEEYSKFMAKRDIYSAGVILYRMLTGGHPFVSDRFTLGKPDTAHNVAMANAWANGQGRDWEDPCVGAFEPRFVNNEAVVDIHAFHNVNPRALHVALRCIAKDRYDNVAEILDEVWLNPSHEKGLGYTQTTINSPTFDIENDVFKFGEPEQIPGERGLFVDASFGFFKASEQRSSPTTYGPFFGAYDCQQSVMLGNGSCVEQLYRDDPSSKQKFLDLYEKVIGRNEAFYGLMLQGFKTLLTPKNDRFMLRDSMEIRRRKAVNVPADRLEDVLLQDAFGRYAKQRAVPLTGMSDPFTNTTLTCSCYRYEASLLNGTRVLNAVECDRLSFLGKDTRTSAHKTGKKVDITWKFVLARRMSKPPTRR